MVEGGQQKEKFGGFKLGSYKVRPPNFWLYGMLLLCVHVWRYLPSYACFCDQFCVCIEGNVARVIKTLSTLVLETAVDGENRA